ncbi:hypothetical protein AWL63_14665 [Sphingomonas panacis]|uniref:Uncharacterized protein n=2 Tax=Sphingomonas panacis TaxID=1560345 RepID=A0A1B3ZC53_9SPHN|nr:hypothetical protein AWL63_14665 [Sphingomonas panacis]
MVRGSGALPDPGPYQRGLADELSEEPGEMRLIGQSACSGDLAERTGGRHPNPLRALDPSACYERVRRVAVLILNARQKWPLLSRAMSERLPTDYRAAAIVAALGPAG